MIVIYMKKLEVKTIIITILLITFQSICYFISKTLCTIPHYIGWKIDDMIPFNIYFIVPYFIWYLLIFMVPYYLYKNDKNLFSKYILSYLLCTLCANIVFIIYPTTVIRPKVVGNSIFHLIAKIIFWIDTPVLNCLPSLHCAISMLFILYILECKCNKNIKISTIVISILIMLSTLYIKQHVFVDLLTGDILALVVYFIIKHERKLSAKIKRLL